MKIRLFGCVYSTSPKAVVKGPSTRDQLKNQPSTRRLLGPTKIPLDNSKIERYLTTGDIAACGYPLKKKVRFHISEEDEENTTLKNRKQNVTCYEGDKGVKNKRKNVTCKKGDKKMRKANQGHATQMKYSGAFYFL